MGGNAMWTWGGSGAPLAESVSNIASIISAPSSSQTDRGHLQTSENKELVKSLRKLRRDDLITSYIGLLGRANLAEEKLQKAAQEFKTTQEIMQDEIAGQNTNIRRAQETVFATLASTGPKAEDDDMIRDKIWAAKKQWKPFAKMWALGHLDDIHNKDAANELFNGLWADTEFTAHDGLNAENNKTKAPYILLNAELARFISECIIQAPFLPAFGLGKHRDDETDDSLKTTNALQSVYDLILKDNPAAAHLWRAQTVAAIDPPSHTKISSDTARRQETVGRKEKLYRYLVTRFETSSARLLFRDINGDALLERRTQLTDIFRAAGQVFSPLWSQRVYLEAWGREIFLKGSFRINDPVIEPHASHKLDPEDPKDGGTSMDNMPIQLVVEPAIVAYGNERGEGYDRYKIWSRAVVWVSSGNPRPAASLRTGALNMQSEITKRESFQLSARTTL